MRSTKTGDKKDEPAGRSQWFHRHESLIPFLLVLVAVAFNLYHLYPELAFKVTGPNDQVLHLLLTDSAMEAITRGQNFTDPWLRATGMGFPLLHYYQPLAHVSAALIHALTLGILSPVNMVDWTTYLLLSLFPISIYWSMRCLDFERLSSAMGGFVASFTATPGLFGLDFHSYVWRGHGLYTQLWGQVLLPPALAMSYRVLREGRGYFWATLLLSATLMSHLIFGLIAFVSLGALAFLPAIRLLTHSDHPRVAVRGQWTRLLILLAMVLEVTSYFLVPMFLDRSLFNPSGVGEDPRKYASYGYSVVLRALARGDLFDFDRFPSFTILLAIGLAICLFRWREERYVIPVAIFLVWLLLYFGRFPWGILIDLVPMGRDIHIHRFIAGVHLGGIFLIAVALAALWHWAMAREGVQYLVAAVALTLLIMMPVYSERRSYLAQNSADMRENQRAMAAENPELSNLFENLKQLPPGRVYAGLTGNWGVEYAIGAVPVLKLLHAEK